MPGHLFISMCTCECMVPVHDLKELDMAFYHEYWGLNSGPQACVQVVLLTEPYYLSCSLILLDCKMKVASTVACDPSTGEIRQEVGRLETHLDHGDCFKLQIKQKRSGGRCSSVVSLTCTKHWVLSQYWPLKEKRMQTT